MHLLSSWWWVMDGFHRQQSRRTVYRVAPVGSVDNSLSFIRGQEPTHQNSRRKVKTLNWLLVTSMHFQSTATKQILPLLWENFVQTLCPVCSDCIPTEFLHWTSFVGQTSDRTTIHERRRRPNSQILFYCATERLSRPVLELAC